MSKITKQGSRVRPIRSHVRPNFSRVRLKKTLVALVRPAIRENKTKVSATQKVSLLFDNRHVSLISWSKPIRDSEGRTPPLIGRGPDIPVCVCVCVCAFEDACAAAVKQRERLVVEMHAALSLNLLYSVNV